MMVVFDEFKWSFNGFNRFDGFSKIVDDICGLDLFVDLIFDSFDVIEGGDLDGVG